MGVSSIEAALGLRANTGSREALLRAAFDLIDTTPGLRVRRRSLVWSVPTGVPGALDELAAGLGVTAQLDIPGLGRLIDQLQKRLRDHVKIELLWAHDPSGTPDVVAIAPTGPDEPERPPMPEGRIVLHDDVRLRASACGPLAEVAELARDPATTRFASEYLKSVPPPLLERPRPFTPGFDALVTTSRADLLAAAAELYCRAPKAALPIGPTTLLPSAAADTPVEIEVPDDAELAERTSYWLTAVGRAVVGNRLAVRRVVVLEDGPTTISGILFGAQQEAAPELGYVAEISASEAPNLSEFEAHVTIDPP